MVRSGAIDIMHIELPNGKKSTRTKRIIRVYTTKATYILFVTLDTFSNTPGLSFSIKSRRVEISSRRC